MCERRKPKKMQKASGAKQGAWVLHRPARAAVCSAFAPPHPSCTARHLRRWCWYLPTHLGNLLNVTDSHHALSEHLVGQLTGRLRRTAHRRKDTAPPRSCMSAPVAASLFALHATARSPSSPGAPLACRQARVCKHPLAALSVSAAGLSAGVGGQAMQTDSATRATSWLGFAHCAVTHSQSSSSREQRIVSGLPRMVWLSGGGKGGIAARVLHRGAVLRPCVVLLSHVHVPGSA
jgi:hypothetical protein